jgi:hypothetical protein
VVTGRRTGRSLCLTERVRSTFSVCASFSLLIGRVVRPVMTDRMHPVVEGAYWTPTGRGHCGVRSVLQCVRSLFRCALLWLDQRVRSSPAHPVRATSASGRWFVKVAVVRSARPVSLTSASGQRDFGCFKCVTAIFEGVRL